MCFKVTCDTCSKPTWEGCGEHIEWALKGVKMEDRCHCKVWTKPGTEGMPCTIL